jgi:hypothetical protein
MLRPLHWVIFRSQVECQRRIYMFQRHKLLLGEGELYLYLYLYLYLKYYINVVYFMGIVCTLRNLFPFILICIR